MSSSPTVLAKAVYEAAKLYEGSFDHAAASRACNAGDPVEMQNFYGMTLREACERQEVNVFLAFPALLMLTADYNSAVDWATVNKDR